MWHFIMGKEQFKEKLVSASCMPRDVVMGAAVVNVLGDFQVCIENYRGIIEYTESLIRIQTKDGRIRICGRRLRIEYYTNDEMEIKGKIDTLEFVSGRESR